MHVIKLNTNNKNFKLVIHVISGVVSYKSGGILVILQYLFFYIQFDNMY
jgi:hypothetical protein